MVQLETMPRGHTYSTKLIRGPSSPGEGRKNTPDLMLNTLGSLSMFSLQEMDPDFEHAKYGLATATDCLSWRHKENSFYRLMFFNNDILELQ